MNLIDKVINDYFSFKKMIHEYFEYKPDWVEIPLEDNREMYWMLLQKINGSGSISFSKTPFTVESIKKGDLYTGIIYTQRFLPKYVYRTEKCVLVSVDTQTDGNKFLMIFDTNKECIDEELKNLYEENWG